jgi:hypothetical protein
VTSFLRRRQGDDRGQGAIAGAAEFEHYDPGATEEAEPMRAVYGIVIFRDWTTGSTSPVPAQRRDKRFATLAELRGPPWPLRLFRNEHPVAALQIATPGDGVSVDA